MMTSSLSSFIFWPYTFRQAKKREEKKRNLIGLVFFGNLIFFSFHSYLFHLIILFQHFFGFFSFFLSMFSFVFFFFVKSGSFFFF
ncbi:hypothetical protein DFH28DRAFT_439610 [Melampsora americana]|nr:hypothetical protein DFH28DRAFT_439610 [Melampsora americana]